MDVARETQVNNGKEFMNQWMAGLGRTWKEWRKILLSTVLLTALTFAAFSPLLNASFVDYDDQIYVTNNARIQAGITWPNVAWAFSTMDFGFYYPLTWMSHMLDCQLYGLHAWGHHLTSILIHIASTLLLLLFLWRATGAYWRSLAVAALFALHPLHVESVAWIAERKDVLSTFFLMLTFLAYERYVRKRGFGRYAAVCVFFLLGLMAKSMLVTAPVLLLLLDVWPLKRLSSRLSEPESDLSRRDAWRRVFDAWRPLVMEKVPLFVLSLIFGILTLYAQNKGGAVNALATLPIWLRLQTVVVGYANYLVKMVVPMNLAVFYPIRQNGWPLSQVILSAFLLALLTLLAWKYRRSNPYVAVGWVWFLAAIAPVSGILQVGQQAYADRYTYVALIGIFLVIVWGLADATERIKGFRPGAMATAAVLVVLSLGATTWHQCRYWRNGVTLFTHSLEAGGWNEPMLNSLGFSLIDEGRAKEAIPFLKMATVLNARSVGAWGNLGNAFRVVGNLSEAKACYRRVLELNPGDVKSLYNLGDTLEREGKFDEALSAFQRRAALQPDNAEALVDVGRLFAETGRMDRATATFRKAVSLAPENPAAHYFLALALDHLGRSDEASSEMHKALEAARRQGDRTLIKKIERRPSSPRHRTALPHEAHARSR
jgi:tetratricopeptide (TPR) repeat protein